MVIYQNVWIDRTNDRPWIGELHIRESVGICRHNPTFLDAIADYQTADHIGHKYAYTMVSDIESGTCEIINIEGELYITPEKVQEDIELEKFDWSRRDAQ